MASNTQKQSAFTLETLNNDFMKTTRRLDPETEFPEKKHFCNLCPITFTYPFTSSFNKPNSGLSFSTFGNCNTTNKPFGSNMVPFKSPYELSSVSPFGLTSVQTHEKPFISAFGVPTVTPLNPVPISAFGAPTVNPLNPVPISAFGAPTVNTVPINAFNPVNAFAAPIANVLDNIKHNDSFEFYKKNNDIESLKWLGDYHFPLSNNSTKDYHFSESLNYYGKCAEKGDKTVIKQLLKLYSKCTSKRSMIEQLITQYNDSHNIIQDFMDKVFNLPYPTPSVHKIRKSKRKLKTY
jgi:hypothetical protein